MIPEEAIEAARAAIRKESMKIHGWGESENAIARAAAEAAAPFIRAQAIEDAADELGKESPFHDYKDTEAHWRIGTKLAAILRARAVAERGGNE
jgi:hypothetical protein